MTLPDLPRKNKKQEANSGLDFRTWIFAGIKKFPSCTFELKDSRGKNYIYLKEITQEQIDMALRTISERGNLIRIVSGTPGAPDYAWYRNADAYFVLNYPQGFRIISIERILEEMKTSKSLTWERACQIQL